MNLWFWSKGSMVQPFMKSHLIESDNFWFWSKGPKIQSFIKMYFLYGCIFDFPTRCFHVVAKPLDFPSRCWGAKASFYSCLASQASHNFLLIIKENNLSAFFHKESEGKSTYVGIKNPEPLSLEEFDVRSIQGIVWFLWIRTDFL